MRRRSYLARGLKGVTPATARKFKKKVTKILVIQKLVVTLQNLSEKSFRSAGRPGTHEENIERITIDK
jgi:hypothetical protein